MSNITYRHASHLTIDSHETPHPLHHLEWIMVHGVLILVLLGEVLAEVLDAHIHLALLVLLVVNQLVFFILKAILAAVQRNQVV